MSDKDHLAHSGINQGRLHIGVRHTGVRSLVGEVALNKALNDITRKAPTAIKDQSMNAVMHKIDYLRLVMDADHSSAKGLGNIVDVFLEARVPKSNQRVRIYGGGEDPTLQCSH